MSQNNKDLLAFDIDIDDLYRIQQELNATNQQMREAFSRAIKRTAGTLKKQSSALVKNDVQVRKINYIRRRLKIYRKKGGEMDELKLWFGLNDMSVSKLKGRAQRIGTKRKPKGAKFTRATGEVVSHKSGFIMKHRGRRSIFIREGKSRFPLDELKAPIHERIRERVEDEIFDELPDIFMHHFMMDLRGRVRGNVQ